ncbi:MAG: ribosomal RNA small subunit methyltransferase A [Syntrophomonadaceae bacterium]|nr:ribosomal RNA small subunit methyltransferase A [Syntrophomonadaceae bacterium]
MLKTSSISNLHILFNKYDVHPKKKWGQNFLVDNNIIQKIIQTADVNSNDYIVEIGPGMGALTQELAARAKGVLSIDIDESLKMPLKEVLAGFENSKLLFADILKVNIEEELIKAFNLPEVPAYKVCANIPYNITTPIIFDLLENCPHLISATLMMQKEVAARILAKPNSKDYGLLTLMVAYYAEAKLGLHVSRNCFYPKPEVDSSVINIIPYDAPAVKVKDEDIFKKFSKSAFQKRRKTILNICSDYFAIDKNEANLILSQLNINPKDRPENLSLGDFAAIVNAF